jgi:MFS family permease
MRALAVICLTTAGWAFTFGVATQAATLWLADAGLGDTLIGLNSGTYYLGIAVASPLVPWLMRRGGPGCAAAGMALGGAAVALFPWAGGTAGWFVLRLLQGAAGALSLIPLETCISRDARPGYRSSSFGLYGVALTLGGAVGIAAGLHLYESGSPTPFVLSGAVSLLSALAVLAGLPGERGQGTGERARSASKGRPCWRCGLSPPSPGKFLSYGTAWGQGFLEGGLLAFLSLYLLALGLSKDAAGGMLGFAMAGVILFQVPLAWLADRLGNTRVLLGCYAVVGAGLVALPLCQPGAWLGCWLFLVGGCCGAFYPLGLALLGERTPAGGLARAYAWYMTIECAGSVLGPVCMGKARAWTGERAMFVVGEAALLLVLLTWAAVRLYNGGDRRQETADRGRRAADRSAA